MCANSTKFGRMISECLDKHYMTKSMRTPVPQTSHSKIMGINMEFAAITSCTLLGRLPIRCWNIAVGTCFHSAIRVLVRSGTDAGRLDLARSQHTNSSQRCSMWLTSELCEGQSSSFRPISTNYFCMDLALCMGALSC